MRQQTTRPSRGRNYNREYVRLEQVQTMLVQSVINTRKYFTFATLLICFFYKFKEQQ